MEQHLTDTKHDTAVAAVHSHAREDASRTQRPGRAEDELQELLTVDDVAAAAQSQPSWVYEHTRARGTPRPNGFPTSRSASTCALTPAPCARS